MYYVHNCHEAIISREDFNKAQEELIRRNVIPLAGRKKAMTVQSRYSRYALSEIVHCGECGSRFRRCTWVRDGVKRIVWRCVNRLESGSQYCKTSPTVDETELHAAIVRAVNRFYEEDAGTYKTLLKVSLNEALGLGGGEDKINLLTRRVDSLNRKMMELVSETVAEGEEMESRESEFKAISDEINQLNCQIEAIKETMESDEDFEDRIRQISEKVDKIQNGMTEYDDTMVRQMIECVRIYSDGKTEVIFGGGYIVDEQVQISSNKRGRKARDRVREPIGN